MFTGLIEEQGEVKNITKSPKGMELTISCRQIPESLKLGASVCINGACQSVVEFGKDFIKIQASNETLNVTNFNSLKTGDKVNLERALMLNQRIDGHLVSGHIDCCAEFMEVKDDGFSKKFFFKISKEHSKYIIYKGSIAINGVSLTVASIKQNIFSVELIPVTLKKVNLAGLKKGDIVNIETDILAKYIEKILNSKDNTSSINYDFLTENGFI